jgi:hypothetical protein
VGIGLRRCGGRKPKTRRYSIELRTWSVKVSRVKIASTMYICKNSAVVYTKFLVDVSCKPKNKKQHLEKTVKTVTSPMKKRQSEQPLKLLESTLELDGKLNGHFCRFAG